MSAASQASRLVPGLLLAGALVACPRSDDAGPPAGPPAEAVSDPELAEAVSEALDIVLVGGLSRSATGPWTVSVSVRDPGGERGVDLAYAVQIQTLDGGVLAGPASLHSAAPRGGSVSLDVDLSHMGPGVHHLRVALRPDPELAARRAPGRRWLDSPVRTERLTVLRHAVSAPPEPAQATQLGELVSGHADPQTVDAALALIEKLGPAGAPTAKGLAARAIRDRAGPVDPQARAARGALRAMGQHGWGATADLVWALREGIAPAAAAVAEGSPDLAGTAAPVDSEWALDVIDTLDAFDDPRAVGVLREIKRAFGPAQGPCQHGWRYCRGTTPDGITPARARIWSAAVAALSEYVDACKVGGVVLHGEVGLVCDAESRKWRVIELGAGFTPSARGLMHVPAAKVVAIIGWREAQASVPRHPEVLVVPVDGLRRRLTRVQLAVHPDALGGELRWPKISGRILTVNLSRDSASIVLSRLPLDRPEGPGAVVTVASRRCKKSPSTCALQATLTDPNIP